MALTPKLEIKQTASLKLTSQLQQAISLLSLSNIELNEFIEQELNSNPLLEREEDIISQDNSFSESSSEINNIQDTAAAENITNDYDEQSHFDDFGSDSEGYNSYEDISWRDYRQNKSSAFDDDNFDYFSERLSKEKSLYEIIKEQIDLKFTRPNDKIIASFLLENLDSSGYFTADISSLAKKIKTPPSRLEKILQELKTFEPSGIFAQNLAECLRIQLDDLGLLSNSMKNLLNNLPLLAAKKLNELCKLCQCSNDELNLMIKQIKSLNPKPASLYTQEYNHNIIPDVIVNRNAHGEYRVELNSLSLPRILINHQYSTTLKQDKKTSSFIKENLSKASFLIKAMHTRANSILRISEELVLRQYHFFEKGIDNLKPMTLKDIALATNLSESTVSRATTGKYLSSPIGIFELKYFFSNAAGSYIGIDDISTTAIKHKIKKLIENESSDNILSDEKLVELLEKDGTKIARRTIAKYRESMDIPTSAERKRIKRA